MDLVLWNRIAIRIYRLSKGKIQDPAVNVNCSEFEVNNSIISEFIFQKLVPIVGVTPYPINELALMVSAVCRPLVLPLGGSRNSREVARAIRAADEHRESRV